MIIRKIKRGDIELIRRIDRSEIIDDIYYFRDKGLVLEREHYDIPGWDPDELNSNIAHIYEVFDRGGTIYGAFENTEIIGVSVLDGKFIGTGQDQLQLYFLHVSNRSRKKGVGRELFEASVNRARQMGAEKLYISATPSKNTVDFYLNLGCRLAQEIDKELFELEPEDIHLEYRIE
jgi:predicted N-acetyltransferase YhbS